MNRRSSAFAVRRSSGGILLIAAAILWWLAQAMTKGRIRRNRWVGLRTRATLSSDQAWSLAHQQAAPATRRAAAAALAGGSAALALRGERVWVPGVLASLGAMAWFALGGARGAGRGSRAAPRRPRVRRRPGQRGLFGENSGCDVETEVRAAVVRGGQAVEHRRRREAHPSPPGWIGPSSPPSGEVRSVPSRRARPVWWWRGH